MPNRRKPLPKVIAENLERLKGSRHDLDSSAKMGGRGKVSQRTAHRALKGNPVKTDSLDGLAQTFGIEPWQLCVPNLDPLCIPQMRGDHVVADLSESDRALLHAYRTASPLVKRMFDNLITLAGSADKAGEVGK